MVVDGIDFNVEYWKGKTKRQFISELSIAFPETDLAGIYDRLFPKPVKSAEVEPIKQEEA